MQFVKGFLSVLLTIVLLTSLIVFSFVYSADSIFSSEKFYTETLEDAGLYSDVYKIFLEKHEKTIYWENQQGEVEWWYLENFRRVFSLHNVTPYMQEMMFGVSKYFYGDINQFPKVDLSELSEELREGLIETLSPKVAKAYLSTVVGRDTKRLNTELLEAESLGGKLPLELKQQIVDDFLFECEDLVEDASMTKTEDWFFYLGYEGLEGVYDAMSKVVYHINYYMIPLLALIIVLTILLILLWLKKLRTSMLFNGWAYMIASIIVVGLSSIIIFADKLFDFAIGLLDSSTLEILELWNVKMLKSVYGYGVGTIGLILFGISVVCFIFAVILKKRKKDKS